MLTFRETKIAKKSWDINLDNIVTSKLIKTKTNSKYLIALKFDTAIRSSVLTTPKMSGYVKTFKVKDGDKDQNSKLMSLRIGDEKLFEEYKGILLRFKILKALT